MHFKTDSMSDRYCFTDCCAATISACEAVVASGKLSGAFGPWQASAMLTKLTKQPQETKTSEETIERIKEPPMPNQLRARRTVQSIGIPERELSLCNRQKLLRNAHF